jgi:hypothetical protein
MLIIFSHALPDVALGRTDYWAPLVVVQIITGILLGPGVLGAAFPAYYDFVFNPRWSRAQRRGLVGGDAVRVDRRASSWTCARPGAPRESRHHRRPGAGRAAAASAAARRWPAGARRAGWAKAQAWQFVLGIGMACAVTALPILILLMEKLEILRQPIGQRILRYASLDDIAIWGVLALILMDWERVGRQAVPGAVLRWPAWVRG